MIYDVGGLQVRLLPAGGDLRLQVIRIQWTWGLPRGYRGYNLWLFGVTGQKLNL